MRYVEEKFSIDAGEKKGRPHPQWYLDCPVILETDVFYFSAFYELHTGRVNGGSLSWKDILLYCQYKGLDKRLTTHFTKIIRAMDNKYLEVVKKDNG